MAAAYETIACKGCGVRITIRTLDWSGDRKAYALNEKFNADVPCDHCEEVFSYRREDIQLVRTAHR